MSEEQFIRTKAGTERPFTVPEGYFEHLEAQLLEQLEQQPVPVIPSRRTILTRMRPLLYAAACLLVFVISSVAVRFARIPSAAEAQAVAVQDTYMDDYADYAMLDNTDIYACLADN
ncbi:MAG: hypothetical protein IJ710_10300 [Prevotella sp.]|nr:hypothetical protein [Prevotella sp.]